MKTIKDKWVKEKVRLDDCHPGDRIKIQGDFVSRYASNDIILIKIKKIMKGKVQIKYRDAYTYLSLRKAGRENNIHKADLLPDLMVERTRKATRDDHESIIFTDPDTAAVDGIMYVDTSGEGKVLERLASEIAKSSNLITSPASLLDLEALGLNDYIVKANVAAILPSVFMASPVFAHRTSRDILADMNTGFPKLPNTKVDQTIIDMQALDTEGDDTP